MNKKNYDTPIIEMLDFDVSDIVTASLNGNIPADTENYEGDIIKFNYQNPNP